MWKSDKFRKLIENENWSTVYKAVGTQEKYNEFIATYERHYNEAFPLTSKTRHRKNQRMNPKLWILPWLENACERKNGLYHAYVKNPGEENYKKYKKMKKFVDKHIKKAKQNYYTKYFEMYKSNSRKQWQMINSVLNRNKKRANITKLIDMTGKEVSSPSKIADTFNTYFTNVAAELKSGLKSNSNICTSHFMHSPIANTIFLTEVSPSEIHDIIKSLKNKVTSDTKITAIKDANLNPEFPKIISHLVITSFTEGIFPKQLKWPK